MRSTTGRPYSNMSPAKEENRQPALGNIALWAGKREPVIYQGNIQMEGEEDKYSVSLFFPKSEHTKAMYGGSISKNFGKGWETLGYIDFYKSKSDKLVAIGFIKWKGEQQASMRVLLFRNLNEAGKENAPKFSGVLIENEKDPSEDKPTPKKVVNTPVKPLHNEKFDESSF